jgi:hypothetical protein
MIPHETKSDDHGPKSRLSPFQIALVEFFIVFLSGLLWNLLRKTGESIVDSFGVAVVTAVFFYFVERERAVYKPGPK